MSADFLSTIAIQLLMNIKQLINGFIYFFIDVFKTACTETERSSSVSLGSNLDSIVKFEFSFQIEDEGSNSILCVLDSISIWSK